MTRSPNKKTPQTYPEFLSSGGEMADRVRAMDWSATPLGAAENWSPALRMAVQIVLANRHPMLLLWGPAFCAIYNDACAPIFGTRHPWALGRPVRECWTEHWDVLQPLIETPFSGGPATSIESLAAELQHLGFAGEAHFTAAFSPVPDESASTGIGGVLVTLHEITGQVVAGRRSRVLRDLGACAAAARSAEHACALAAEILNRHPLDLPFALLYLLDAEGRQVRLAGAAGVTGAEALGPVAADLDGDGPDCFPWPFREAMGCADSLTVANIGERLGDAVPPGPWADPPHTALILPIRFAAPQPPAGFLVAGISSRLRLDEAYRDFLDLVAARIAVAMTCGKESARQPTQA